MGFSLIGSNVVFFIASLIVAGTVSGIFIAVTLDISSSLSDSGDRLQEQLDTDFKIINDPSSIPSSGNDYIFYLKNIGGKKLITTNETFQVFCNGEIISVSQYYFNASSISVGEVTELFIIKAEIPNGDSTLRVVGPMAVTDEFAFTL